MNAVRRSALVATLALSLVAAPTAALANNNEMAAEAGIGAASALSTLIYGPVKIVYAALGLVIGGTAWGLSGGDHDVLAAVITPAVRGDYVVTPSHLRMERGLEFYGQSPSYRSVQHAAVNDGLKDTSYQDSGYPSGGFLDEGFVEEDY